MDEQKPEGGGEILDGGSAHHEVVFGGEMMIDLHARQGTNSLWCRLAGN